MNAVLSIRVFTGYLAVLTLLLVFAPSGLANSR